MGLLETSQLSQHIICTGRRDWYWQVCKSTNAKGLTTFLLTTSRSTRAWTPFRASATLLWLSVHSTGNKKIFQYQPSVNQYSPSVKKVSFINVFSVCVGATDVWSRSSFWVTTCTFFSADVGKTTDRVLMTRPLQTVIKLGFVANVSESFRVHCFACWTSPEVILFSRCFHLFQDPWYIIWSLASHTKHSVGTGNYIF